MWPNLKLKFPISGTIFISPLFNKVKEEISYRSFQIGFSFGTFTIAVLAERWRGVFKNDFPSIRQNLVLHVTLTITSLKNSTFILRSAT